MRRACLLSLFVAACGGAPPPATTAYEEPPPAAIPQPNCVTDSTADALARAQAEGIELGEGAPTSGTLDDVDGDSTPETIVALDCGATGACRRAIYFSGHECARFAVAMPTQTIQLSGGWHRGVHDIQTFEPRGCAGLAGTIIDWVWDGETYVDTITLECPCPDGSNDATRAPRCPR